MLILKQTLKDLQKKAKAGRKIPEADIPPEVAVGIVRPSEGGAPQIPTTVSAPVPPAPAIGLCISHMLMYRYRRQGLD